MTIDIELLLAWHPLLLLWRKCCVKCLDSSSVPTAVGGGRWNVHPLSAVERIRYKLANEKRRWEVSVYDEADVLLFAAHETSAAFLRLSDYRRMTIDIEFLLAWHPLLFFWWKSGVKGFNCGGVLTAIGSS